MAIKIFSASSFCCFPSAVNVTPTPAFVFSTFSIFERHHSRKHLQNSHVRIERLENRSKFHSYRTRSHHDQRLRNRTHLQNFDIREHAIIESKSGNYSRLGPHRQNYVFCLNLARLASIFHFDRMDPTLRRPSQLAEALHGIDFVFSHQELQTLRMLVHDFRLALLHRLPIQFARVHTLNPVFLCVFQMVPQFRIKQQSLRRNAAHVQAGAAEIRVFLYQSRLKAVLTCANRGRISRRSAANYGDVISYFSQSGAPLFSMDELRQTNDSRPRSLNAKWSPGCIPPANGTS